jgi:hypothetical protein
LAAAGPSGANCGANPCNKTRPHLLAGLRVHQYSNDFPTMQIDLPNGEQKDIAHLAPRFLLCASSALSRDIQIKAIFQNHCYTEKFDEAKHTRDEILCYDAPDRPRCFCPTRYELSRNLPALIDDLPTKRIHQTAQVRNYVYVASLNITNQVYEIYFMLQRAAPDDEADLRLTVESAYPKIIPTVLPNRPRAIRFRVLAQKVLLNQPVRFAPR